MTTHERERKAGRDQFEQDILDAVAREDRQARLAAQRLPRDTAR